jgi:cysteine desulfurase
MGEFVYLDYNATTPVAPEVLHAMLPWMSEQFWNAASAHVGGRMASRAVEQAREQVAALIGASPREVVWTSGSTEANNLAIKGTAANAAPGSRVLVASTEHKAVLDTAYALEASGIKIEEIGVSANGTIDPQQFRTMVADDVALVSVMLANNETGVIQPIKELVEIAHDHGALFHTDATQAVGRVPVDVSVLGVDLASISGHKFYGPKGIGCLYVARGTDLEPQIHGGGHEAGRRSGTSNVPGIVGLGCAAELAAARLDEDGTRASQLVERLVAGLQRSIPAVEVVAEDAPKLPNTTNLRFVGADGEAVMANAPTVLMSSGSACTAMIPDASHVLMNMGYQQDEAFECLRFSVGRGTTIEDIDDAIRSVSHAVDRVRTLNDWKPEGTY